MDAKNIQNTTGQAVNYTDLLASVLKSIYWSKFTVNQQTVITNIIKDSELILEKQMKYVNFLKLKNVEIGILSLVS